MNRPSCDQPGRAGFLRRPQVLLIIVLAHWVGCFFFFLGQRMAQDGHRSWLQPPVAAPLCR